MHCNALQHAATYCSTLHAATHCNTLQYTATHYNTLQHTLMHCTTLQHAATRCNTLQHIATHCNTLQHSHCLALQYTATHCNTLHHTATHGNTLQHTAIHCNTLQHAATRCNTLEYRNSIVMQRQSKWIAIVFSQTSGNLLMAVCNTLQHTATHCNSLYHATKHCTTQSIVTNTLLHKANRTKLYCLKVQKGALFCYDTHLETWNKETKGLRHISGKHMSVQQVKEANNAMYQRSLQYKMSCFHVWKATSNKTVCQNKTFESSSKATSNKTFESNLEQDVRRR